MTNKQRLAILLFTLFLLALVTPVPQVVAAQGFNSVYNASSGKFLTRFVPRGHSVILLPLRILHSPEAS